jgi:hypothetical protein
MSQRLVGIALLTQLSNIEAKGKNDTFISLAFHFTGFRA